MDDQDVRDGCLGAWAGGHGPTVIARTYVGDVVEAVGSRLWSYAAWTTGGRAVGIGRRVMAIAMPLRPKKNETKYIQL